MTTTKDYTTMTLDELVSEEKKVNAQKIPFAVFIGFLVGVAFWSATHQGGFVLTVILLISAGLTGSTYSKKLKSIQTELSRRSANR